MATTTTAVSAASALPIRLQNFFARYPPQLYSAKFTGITIPLTRKDAKEAAVARAAELEKPAALSRGRPHSNALLAQPILPPSTTKTEISSEFETPLSEPLQDQQQPDPIPTPNLQTVEPSLNDSSSIVEELVMRSRRSEQWTLSSSHTPPPPVQKSPPVEKFPPNPFLPRKNFISGRWAGPKIGLRVQAELVKLARRHDLEDLLPPGKKSTIFKQTRLLERGLRIKGTGEGQKVKGHKWERRLSGTLDKRRKAMENMPTMVREWKQKGHGRGWTKFPSSKASKN